MSAPPARSLPPLFVLNLARSVERRERMEQQAASLGLGLTFVPAVDGTALAPEQRARVDEEAVRRRYGRPLRAGEIGCYLSHLLVWERLAAGDDACAVVLEDDARLDATFAPAVAAVLAAPVPWDVVRLTGYFHRPAQRVARLADGRDLVRNERGINGTTAYLVRREGAARLVAYSRTLCHPVDNAMDRTFEHELALLCVRPFAVGHDDGQPSTIQRTAARGGVRGPWTERAARRLLRTQDSLRRRWHNLRKHGLV